MTKKTSKLQFKLEKILTVDGMDEYNVRRLKENRVLTYHLFHAQSKIIIVAQDHIE